MVGRGKHHKPILTVDTRTANSMTNTDSQDVFAVVFSAIRRRFEHQSPSTKSRAKDVSPRELQDRLTICTFGNSGFLDVEIPESCDLSAIADDQGDDEGNSQSDNESDDIFSIIISANSRAYDKQRAQPNGSYQQRRLDDNISKIAPDRLPNSCPQQATESTTSSRSACTKLSDTTKERASLYSRKNSSIYCPNTLSASDEISTSCSSATIIHRTPCAANDSSSKHDSRSYDDTSSSGKTTPTPSRILNTNFIGDKVGKSESIKSRSDVAGLRTDSRGRLTPDRGSVGFISLNPDLIEGQTFDSVDMALLKSVTGLHRSSTLSTAASNHHTVSSRSSCSFGVPPLTPLRHRKSAPCLTPHPPSHSSETPLLGRYHLFPKQSSSEPTTGQVTPKDQISENLSSLQRGQLDSLGSHGLTKRRAASKSDRSFSQARPLPTVREFGSSNIPLTHSNPGSRTDRNVNHKMAGHSLRHPLKPFNKLASHTDQVSSFRGIMPLTSPNKTNISRKMFGTWPISKSTLKRHLRPVRNGESIAADPDQSDLLSVITSPSESSCGHNSLKSYLNIRAKGETWDNEVVKKPYAEHMVS